ncbi:MAG: hypothetical protein JNJ78_04470 [Anaerolineae bacterium]|nr:hypothetical protein [Anaerolineae bacterium]
MTKDYIARSMRNCHSFCKIKLYYSLIRKLSKKDILKKQVNNSPPIHAPAAVRGLTFTNFCSIINLSKFLYHESSHVTDHQKSPFPSTHCMADMAAFVCGSSPSSRIRPFFVGGCLPASRCHCRMAAANTVLPAAKSAKQAASRRSPPMPGAPHASSRRQ